MPTSRKRRPPKKPAPRKPAPKKPAAKRPAPMSDTDLLATWPLIHATDDAEARGDVAGALALIDEDLRQRDPDEEFWRPWRLRRLWQLDVFGPVLPRWATSRWVLAQAHQFLDPEDRVSGGLARDRAIEVRGAESFAGMALRDVHCQVMDHDWVHRQVFLYDLGGLNRFLRRGATADLLAGADAMREWARTPMGGYRRLDVAGPDLGTWEDLATGARLEVLELGSVCTVTSGECVLGRLVPTEGGRLLFESAPLFVPDDVAQQVADDPAGWTDALAEGCRRDLPPEQTIRTGGHDFELLTDVSEAQRFVWVSLLWSDVTEQDPSPERLTEGELLDREATVVRAALGGHPATEGPVDRAVVAATLLQPPVFHHLLHRLGPAERRALQRLSGQLPPPGDAVSLLLAEHACEAA